MTYDANDFVNAKSYGRETYARRVVKRRSGAAPNENIVQNHLNIALLNLF